MWRIGCGLLVKEPALLSLKKLEVLLDDVVSALLALVSTSLVSHSAIPDVVEEYYDVRAI